MSETKSSQVQDTQAGWRKAVDEQVTRATGFFDEMAKLEAKRVEQAGGVVDEVARMTKQSFGYMSQLSSEWRKLSLEATKRAVQMMSFGGL